VPPAAAPVSPQAAAAAAAAGMSAAPEVLAGGCGKPVQWVELPDGSMELMDVTKAMPNMGQGPNSSQDLLASLQQQSAGLQGPQVPMQTLYHQQLVLLEQERQQLQHQLDVLEAFYSAQQQQQLLAPSTALPGHLGHPCSSGSTRVSPFGSLVTPTPLLNTGSQAHLLAGPEAAAAQHYAASPPTHQLQLQQVTPGAMQGHPRAAMTLAVTAGPGPTSGPESPDRLMADGGTLSSSSGMGMGRGMGVGVSVGVSQLTLPVAVAAAGATPSPTHHSPAATCVSLALVQQTHEQAAAWVPHNAPAAAAACVGRATSPSSAAAESAFDIALRNMCFDSTHIDGDTLGAALAAAAPAATAQHAGHQGNGSGSSSRGSTTGKFGSMAVLLGPQGGTAPAGATAVAAAAGQQQEGAAAAGAAAAAAGAGLCGGLSPEKEDGLLDLLCMDTSSLCKLSADEEVLADHLAAAIVMASAGLSSVHNPVPMQLEGQVKVGPLGQSGWRGPGVSATSASLSVLLPPEGCQPPMCSPFAAAAASANHSGCQGWFG
jgi:hypothetical protein